MTSSFDFTYLQNSLVKAHLKDNILFIIQAIKKRIFLSF